MKTQDYKPSIKEELVFKHYCTMLNSLIFTTSQYELWYIDYLVSQCNETSDLMFT